MKISIIGTGNVATIFAKLAYLNQHTIVDIIGRNEVAGNVLAKSVQANYTTIENMNMAVNLIIIAVADNAIADIVIKLVPSKAIVVHTAGSVSINLLANKFESYGVIYPLQSLRKDMVTMPEIPLLLEANDEKAYTLLENFSKSISKTVAPITENERLHLHTAAVIVNNFTNYLYSEAYQLCQANKINFDLLLPLIKETANRVGHSTPLKMQTGPAIRNDSATIEKHLVLLEKYPNIKRMYTFLTNSILNMYVKKKIA